MKKTVFFFLFFLGLALLVYCLEQQPHVFRENECVICHQGKPGTPNSILHESPTLACSGCHADVLASGFMHPIDVRPEKVAVPRDFPLSPSGLIVCTTCHDVHGAYLDSQGETTAFLRRPERGRAFCASCHSQSSLSGAGGHELALAEAHFQSKYIVAGDGQELDETSKNCISCHDGAYGSSVSITSGVWRHSSKYGGGASAIGNKHPIGIDYEEARLRPGRKTDLRPMALVDPRIRFFDGRLGCGTCHDPYSHLDDDLVMSNARSALCFACHAID
ncbi:MAG: cytochrome c3 family protein [Thermodesulfobacteriota bacterium]